MIDDIYDLDAVDDLNPSEEDLDLIEFNGTLAAEEGQSREEGWAELVEVIGLIDGDTPCKRAFLKGYDNHMLGPQNGPRN